MKNYKIITILSLVVLVSSLLIMTSPNLTSAGETNYPDEVSKVLITYKDFDTMSLEKLEHAGAKIDRVYSLTPTVVVDVVQTQIPTIKKIAGVIDVEFNQMYTADLIPDDPSYSQLWGMEKIQAPQAWDFRTDAGSILVAVIDEGFQVNHPDLVGNVWTNPGEIAGNGIDDDGNGYIDDMNGWDFYNDDASVYDGFGDDHGTHVAGTVGAVGNNGIGVTGVAWNVQLMSLKFLGPFGGSTVDAISAIEYATQMGADIISASWGGGSFSQALKDAIDNFPGLFVAAAGNDGLDNDIFPHYPSSYTSSNLIAVASTSSTDSMASTSNYGITSVDIAAPGVSILSTLPGGYGLGSGTSMATPHVSGAAALLLADNPTLSPQQLKQRLMDYADPLNSLIGEVVSGARLNVYNAISETPPPPPPPPPPTLTDTFIGTVSSGSDRVHSFEVTAVDAEIEAVLSWPSGPDVDMYLYRPGADPTGFDWVTRAYTLRNPETISFAPDVLGAWQIRVDMFSFSATADYTLDVTYPVADDARPEAVEVQIVEQDYHDLVVSWGTDHYHDDDDDDDDDEDDDWDTDSNSNVAYYNIYRDGFLITSVSANRHLYRDTPLEAGTTFRYQVTAVDNTGTEGPLISPVSGTTVSFPPSPTLTETFTGTVSSGIDTVHTFDVTSTSGEITAILSWPSGPDVDMYLYRPGSDPTGFNWVTRAFTLRNPETISFTADTLGLWQIRVNMYSFSATADYTLNVTYPIAAGPAPTQVQDVEVEEEGRYSVEIEWENDDDDGGDIILYYVYRDGVWIAALSGHADEYEDRGLEAGTSYTYEIAAVSSYGIVGERSTPVTVTTEN